MENDRRLVILLHIYPYFIYSIVWIWEPSIPYYMHFRYISEEYIWFDGLQGMLQAQSI